MAKDSTIKRPLLITIIAAALLLSGVVGIAVNTFYMVEFTASFMEPLNLAVFMLEVAFSILYIVVAQGLLAMEEYARRWGVIILVAGVALRVIVLAIRFAFGKPLDEILINLYIAVYVMFAAYLHKNGARKAFSQAL